MMTSGSRPGVVSSPRPLLGAGLDTSEGRAFVRERLSLLGKVIFLLSFGFYVLAAALQLAVGTMSPLEHLVHTGALMHLAGAAIMAKLWLVSRRPQCTIRSLGLLDAVALLLTCWFWGLMVEGGGDARFAAMLSVSITVIARAVIVPSSARRTFLLSSIAMAPMVGWSLVWLPAVELDGQPVPGPVAMLIVGSTALLWSGIAIAVATVASSVIYGLRQRVREASELGAYTLEEKIGSGGMGEVWRAHHRMLIRPAAVKLIRPSALGSSPSDPEVLLRRFEREARTTAALKSPHTVQLYDFGVAEDGTLYYVMELLEGFNLDQLVTRFGPVPAERAVHILHQVCCSLIDAHKNGLIHRDIKPANIILTRFGGAADFTKVLDFGLVKLDRPRESADPRLTADASTTGTPAFMAPEAVVGEGASDHRVDLYSLGCVAYWLLTGKLVFEGANSMKVMIDHAHSVPPRPSTRVELPIPMELEELVLQCLEKDPDRRPASAAELAERLQAIPLPRRWTQDRAERWWATHARDLSEQRPIADIVLSHEGRPGRKLTFEAAARR